MSLTFIHSISKSHPHTILQAIPSTRYFALISCELQRRSDFHEYSSVLLSTEDDAYVWGYYGKYREIPAVHPFGDAIPNKVYWRGKSPKPFIDAFLKALNKEVDVKYDFKRHIATFPIDFEMLPWVLGGLRVYLTSFGITSSCRYALPPLSAKSKDEPKTEKSSAPERGPTVRANRRSARPIKQITTTSTSINPTTLKAKVKIVR